MIKSKIYRVLLFILSLWSFFLFASADTGTYKILDYVVKLTPHSDGTVEIEYYQKWLVTGGHIPWITIGTANSNFRIDLSKNRGNIRNIYSYNSTNWSGVRIDLDKDYLPSEIFEVGFSLIQSKLFYADENNYKLDFTPGWYDRAITERLIIIIRIFAPIEQVNASPRPTRIKGEELVWEVYNLGKGQRFSVSISFPKRFMPSITASALKSRGTVGNAISWFILLFPFLIVFFVITVIIISIVKGSRYGRGGNIYVGGVGGGRGGRSSGGGGGFGGRASSCACACVSCACACACAGGGGAGCTKKIIHNCIICTPNKGS
jgi:uncharacterized membrane protein YgcG